MGKKLNTTMALLATLALLWAGPAFAAWQAERPAAQEQQQEQASSPFALPAKGQAADKPAAPAKSSSPFALPEKGQAASPPASESKSPFALPDKKAEPPAAAADTEKLMNQGMAAARAGRLDEAGKAFWAAARAEPKDPRAWNNLGLVLRKQGKLNQAADAYRRALEADANFAVAYKNLGVLLEQAGEDATAAKAYLKYVQINPQAPDAAQVKKRALWLINKGGGK
jgi:Flp pilus assembly protein TadD